jgi:hypothetical protein
MAPWIHDIFDRLMLSAMLSWSILLVRREAITNRKPSPSEADQTTGLYLPNRPFDLCDILSSFEPISRAQNCCDISNCSSCLGDPWQSAHKSQRSSRLTTDMATWSALVPMHSSTELRRPGRRYTDTERKRAKEHSKRILPSMSRHLMA